MVIKASSAAQIATLVADLASDNPVTRDAAVARLTVFGARAVDRLLAVVDTEAKPSARTAALRALEAIAEPRALPHLMSAVRSTETSVATAAVQSLRPFLRLEIGVKAVDCLTGIALDQRADEGVRVAAVRALRELEPSSLEPLLAALNTDKSAAVRAETAAAPAPPRESAEAVLARASASLPEQPDELLEAVAAAGSTAPLTTLLAVVERLREREDQLAASRRGRWTEARGHAHLALARRRSRIALYDLRESLHTAGAPLPADFLSALSKIGDESCLEAVAAAYAHSLESSGSHGEAWREQLADAFRSIAAREALTRRHAVMKRIGKRWPRALTALWPR